MSTEAILRAIHADRVPSTYFELGVEQGQYWHMVGEQCRSVGIAQAANPSLNPQGAAQLFVGTAAEFFSQHPLETLWHGDALDLAVLDGNQPIDVLLAALVGVERVSGPRSVWVIRCRAHASHAEGMVQLLQQLACAIPHWHMETVVAAPDDITLITGMVEGERPCAAVQSQQGQAIGATPTVAVESRRAPAIHVAAAKPRMLGVLMCYNDGDILGDAIEHLLVNNHDLVIWDHGSQDATSNVIARYANHVVEHRHIGREVDFYGLYQAMSQSLMQRWVHAYDWISWPDQDEILEGPDRSMGYAGHVARVLAEGYDWVQFNNYNYWWTEQDAVAIASPVRRVRHYALFADCSPRIRAWRASCTNVRAFNHNPIEGKKYPEAFNLRHYPMRSRAQMQQRIDRDRASLQRGTMNYHYSNMAQRPERLIIPAQTLHFDDGLAELSAQQVFDWRTVYGHPPAP